MAAAEFLDALGGDVETGDVMPRRLRQGERQADISEADDGDGGHMCLTWFVSGRPTRFAAERP